MRCIPVFLIILIFAGCAHTPYNRAYVSNSIADRAEARLQHSVGFYQAKREN